MTAPDAPSTGQVAQSRRRALRGVVFALAGLALLVVISALLQPSRQPQYLDPDSAGRDGARALVQILRQRDVHVQAMRDAVDARMAARPDGTLVVVRSERLAPEELNTLRHAPGDLLLVEPSRSALRLLAPGVEPAGSSYTAEGGPECALPAAASAGEVRFEVSELYLAPPEAVRCYPSEGAPRLVRLAVHGRTVTVLGSGWPLTNGRLAQAGNAALAMNLVGARSSVVWLIPDPPEPGEVEAQSWQDLLPPGVRMFALQVCVAVVLVALWRMRRMGPVVAESLPVAVRSAETVEGRARLYRAHRARDSAAEALRVGARDRLVPLLGLPPGAARDPSMAQKIVTALARRTHRDEQAIGWALYGPPPEDDARLLALTDFLDDLERQVRRL